MADDGHYRPLSEAEVDEEQDIDDLSLLGRDNFSQICVIYAIILLLSLTGNVLLLTNNARSIQASVDRGKSKYSAYNHDSPANFSLWW